MVTSPSRQNVSSPFHRLRPVEVKTIQSPSSMGSDTTIPFSVTDSVTAISVGFSNILIVSTTVRLLAVLIEYTLQPADPDGSHCVPFHGHTTAALPFLIASLFARAIAESITSRSVLALFLAILLTKLGIAILDMIATSESVMSSSVNVKPRCVMVWVLGIFLSLIMVMVLAPIVLSLSARASGHRCLCKIELLLTAAK